MRPRNLRILPDDLDRLELGLGINWIQGKQTLQEGNAIDALGALALEANVDASDFNEVADYCKDEYGRDYMRGYCQGWDNDAEVLTRFDNLDNPTFLEGYDDGLDGAVYVGLIESKPILEMEQLRLDAVPRDPVRDAAPFDPILLIERKTKKERSPEEREKVRIHREKRKEQRITSRR